MTSFARNSTYGEVWGRIDREYRYSKTYYEVGRQIFKEIFVRSKYSHFKGPFQTLFFRRTSVFFGRPCLLKLSSFKGLVRFQFVLL